jgi:hypothetical protein
MQLVQPLPFDEAVDKLGRKSLIGSQLSSSEWRDVPVALRERAFFSSQVESARVLQRARDTIADFLQSNVEKLPSGETALATGGRASFVKNLQDFLRGEGIDRTDGGLKDLAGEKRLGLIFDVQTRQANDYGYWKQGQDPDVLDAFPAQRFIRMLDVKDPRDAHSQYEDQVYLKSDPIWVQINDDFGVPWGPWGWGCGHDVEDVSRDEAEALGLLQPGQAVVSQESTFNDQLKASTRGLDPDLLAKLQTELGDQLVIEGETMRWKSEVGRVALRPPPEPTAPAAPAASAAPVAPTLPSKPVSAALQVKTTGPLKQSITTAIKAIDKVHDDGVLPSIPVTSSRKKNSLGVFTSTRQGGQSVAKSIEVRSSGSWPALTAAHEAGHFLDLEAIGAKGGFATDKTGPIQNVIQAARSSDAIKGIQKLQAESSGRTRRYYNYLLSPSEIWARAYAQFIAEESGEPVLVQELEKARSAQEHRQWKTADFKPVAAEIRKMFKQMGWTK